MTADSLRPTVFSLGRTLHRKRAGAVSRRPKAVPALVYELHGRSEKDIRIVEGAM
jgi:hypothetical protein